MTNDEPEAKSHQSSATLIRQSAMDATAGDSFPAFTASKYRFYERAFLLLGMGATGALLLARDSHPALAAEILAGTALYYVALRTIARTDSIGGERMRLIATYLFTFWFYGVTSRISPALGTPTFDGGLLAADRFLFGETPAVYFEQIARPWLTDLLSICYLSYLIYLHLVVIWALSQSARVISRFGASIFTGFAAGFLSYLLLPALGPGPAFPSLFSSPLHGSALTWLNDAVVTRGAAIYGTFPSLHLLITLLLLDNDWRECRMRFWIMLAPAVGLVISTLYLRYHYATDLLAGVVFFIVLRSVSRRLQSN